MQLELLKRRLTVNLSRAEPASAPPDADELECGDLERGEPRDLVQTHSKKVAILLLVVAAGLLVWSSAYGVRKGLPSVALDWIFGLQLIRAGLAFAIIAALAMLLIRGFGGMWPDNLLTTGFSYPTAERVVEQGIASTKTVTEAARSELELIKSTELRE